MTKNEIAKPLYGASLDALLGPLIGFSLGLH